MSDNSKNSDNNFQNINLQHAKESLKLTLDQALFNIGTKTAIYTQQNKFIVSMYNPIQAVHAFVFKEQCELPNTESYTFLYLEFFTAQVHEITMNFEYTDDSRPSVEQLITAATGDLELKIPRALQKMTSKIERSGICLSVGHGSGQAARSLVVQ